MSTLKVNTIQNTSGGSSSTPEQIQQGRAKAWAIFSGTGTPSLADDFGVSSITDHGTGSYQVNFDTAFSSVNYSPLASCRYQSNTSGQTNSDNIFAGFMNFNQLAANTILYTRAATGSHYDVAHVYFAAFGD